jgi:outer membrane protein assembly factor BamB
MLHVRGAVFAIIAAFLAFAQPAAAEDWPQWRGKNRDGVWTETGIVDKLPSGQLPIKWRVEVGSGYSGPTVAEGQVFLTDRLTKPEEIERILCFKEATGKLLWKHEYPAAYGRVGYPAGPRASVTVHQGKAYALGATGAMYCVEAASGKILWQADLNERYAIDMPIWGITAAPLIFEDLVILHIGGRDACIVGLNKDTGAEVWKSLSDRGQYSAPILVEQAGQPVAICWTGDSVAGLAPATGKVLWRVAWKPRNMPIGVATPVVHGDRVFFTSFYDGSLMLRLTTDQSDPTKPAVETLWQRVGRNENPPNTDALQSIIATPVFDGTHIYGVDSYGQLRCLDAATGDRLWEDLTAVPMDRWSTIHFVQHGDKYWLFNEQGELIIARLTPAGYEELSRAKLLEPTTDQLKRRGGKGVCWSHPAFANRHIFQRSDKELVCASLAAE